MTATGPQAARGGPGAARAGRGGIRRRRRARAGRSPLRPPRRQPRRARRQRRPPRRHGRWIPPSLPAPATCSAGWPPRPGWRSGRRNASTAGRRPRLRTGPSSDPAAERALLDRGLAAAREAVAHDREVVARRAGAAEAEIFDAHVALLGDAALLDPARAAIDGDGAPSAPGMTPRRRSPPATARCPIPCWPSAPPTCSTSDERVVAAPSTGTTATPRGAPAGVVIADELTPATRPDWIPSRCWRSPRRRGSVTAHAAILARALGLPAVVGLGAAVLQIPDGTTLLLDGEAGTVIVDPPAGARREAEQQRDRLTRRRAAARAHAAEPAVTRDGQPDRRVRQPRLVRRDRPCRGARRRGGRAAAHRVLVPRSQRASRRGGAGSDAPRDRRRARRTRADRAHARRRRRQAAAGAADARRGQPVSRRARHPARPGAVRRSSPPSSGRSCASPPTATRSRRCCRWSRRWRRSWRPASCCATPAATRASTCRWSWASWSRCRRRR